MAIGSLSASGKLSAKLLKRKAPFSWKFYNSIRPSFWLGWLAVQAAKSFSKLTGTPTLTSQLSAVLRRHNGEVIDFGVVSYRVVTTAFVNFLVDQLQTDTTAIGDFKYHGSGTTNTAEASGDTGLGTEVESRATGTQTEGASANIYKSVGTCSYTATRAIVEHGLFNASSGVTLMDRSVFSTINVVNGDSIQFTYELTCSAGG